jgi:spermidine/putrescine transport system substrate-binding protein
MDFDRRLKAMISRNPLQNGGPAGAMATRRQLLMAMGAAAAMTSFGGMTAAAQAADRPLNLLTWDPYADPRMLDAWRAATGGTLHPEVHISDPVSVNRLRAGETKVWDFVNLNNPWARRQLWPEKLIRDLPMERFAPLYDKMFAKFKLPYRWAMSDDGKHLLGVVQRTETFDFVVNTDVISEKMATDEGWDLFNNPDFAKRYGILAYEDWNVMDICMGAGVNPFAEKTDADIAKFKDTADRWIQNAAMITTDFVQLNLAVLNKEIDLYFTGGTYSTSGARLEGNKNLLGIAPARGPADGKGAINWVEVNSAVANPDEHPKILDFLEWITEPDQAYIVASGNGNLQPVAQMAQQNVMAKFSPEQLDALQWNTFEERVARAVEFDTVPQYDKLYDLYTAAMRTRG